MAGVKLTDDAKADLAALPSPKLQKVALQWMARLRRAPQLGRALEWREGQDLRTCRKLYFDENDTPLEERFVPETHAAEGPRYRIVYRLLPDDEAAAVVQVLGVGAKRDSEGGIYPRVANRIEGEEL